jgi:hypothetical protein
MFLYSISIGIKMAETEKKETKITIIESISPDLYSFPMVKKKKDDVGYAMGDILIIGLGYNAVTQDQLKMLEENTLFQDLSKEEYLFKREFKQAIVPKSRNTKNSNELAAQELCKLSEDDLLKIIRPDDKKKGLLNTFQIGLYKENETRANCVAMVEKKLSLRK